jgi:hypothetical protein
MVHDLEHNLYINNRDPALLNISRMTRADSPMYLSTIADETTFKKLQSRVEATARASKVFPVPVYKINISMNQVCTWRSI